MKPRAEPANTGIDQADELVTRLPRRALLDALVIGAICVATFFAAASVDAFESLHAFADAHEDWELDELFTLTFVLVVGLAVFALRRLADHRAEVKLRRAAEAEAHALALFDPLTGLANRRRLRAEAGRMLHHVDRIGPPIACLVIDLDGFKKVNDLLGHEAGDTLLQAVADRLRHCTRAGDELARTGGDEFAALVVLDGSIDEAERIAHRIVTALARPFQVGGTSARIGASVGIALAPQDATQPDQLLARADAAMYRAKAGGKNGFRFFEQGMDDRLRERALLEAALRDALEAGQIVPHYQPLTDLGSGRVIGFEALARWRLPDGTNVPPDVFIPLAEDAGLIAPLTMAIMRRAFADAAAWPNDVMISVNVSALLLSEPDLARTMLELAAEAGLKPQRIEVEVTESAVAANQGHARSTALKLKQAGIAIVMDDFGTGYSSLANLRALPFDRIKIDRSFVASMLTSEESGKIVAAIVSLGHSLGLPLTAEGIENEAVAARLATMGCGVGQGWLFGKAMPAEAVSDLLVGHVATSDVAR